MTFKYVQNRCFANCDKYSKDERTNNIRIKSFRNLLFCLTSKIKPNYSLKKLALSASLLFLNMLGHFARQRDLETKRETDKQIERERERQKDRERAHPTLPIYNFVKSYLGI
jgi:hypothetical protein